MNDPDFGHNGGPIITSELDRVSGVRTRTSGNMRISRRSPMKPFTTSRALTSAREELWLAEKPGKAEESQSIDHLPGFGYPSALHSVDEYGIC